MTTADQPASATIDGVEFDAETLAEVKTLLEEVGPSTTDDPELFAALAVSEHTSRIHLLWEVAADGRDFVGVEATRDQLDADYSRGTNVARFAEGVTCAVEGEPGTDIEWLEQNHGETVDGLCDALGVEVDRDHNLN